MREKVEILESAGQMVLAAHRTPVGSGLTAVTVETVTLDTPHRMGFRLLRGPRAARDRDLHPRRDRRRDPAQLRRARHRPLATRPAWGDLVARSWVDAVCDSMAAIKTESERRATG
jgi:hypothetical protein